MEQAAKDAAETAYISMKGEQNYGTLKTVNGNGSKI